MIARLLQFVFLVLLFRFLWSLVMKLLARAEASRVGGASFGRNPQEPLHRGQMVRDSVCGVFVPRERSLEARRGGEIFYFCSETCRQAFRKNELPAR